MSDPPAPAIPPRWALAQCSSVLLAIAIYAPALDGPFVWDDRLLLDTAQIAELQPLRAYFLQPFWQVTEVGGAPAPGQGAYYRPLAALSLALDRQLHGDNATGFHLLGLCLHGLNAALVLGLARRLGASLLGALLGALLFAWFPRLTESAAWISGRTDVLATTFALCALVLTLGSWRPRRFLAAGCILLGAFCKEVALAAAIGIVVWEWRAEGEGRWRRLLPTLLASAVYLALRTWVLAGISNPSPLTIPMRLTVTLEAVARYAWMLVDGWQPRLQIGYVMQPSRMLALAGLLLLPLPVLLLRKLRGRRDELSLLIVGLCAIGFVLHLVPIQGKVIAADRFLYLPMAMLGALAAAWLSQVRGRMARAALAVGGAVVLSYAPATWQRAGVWGDDIAFWGTAVAERPGILNAHPRLGLGNLLAEHGMAEEALHQYELAERGDTHSWRLCQYNRASTLAMNGEFDAAIAVLEAARRVMPNASQLRRLAQLHASKGDREAALRFVRAYAAEGSDAALVAELDTEVTTVARLMPEILAPKTTLSDKLAQARAFAEVGLLRLAMSTLVSLLDDPGITPAHLQGMLSSALEHGTPEQVEAILARMHARGIGYPDAYALLWAERSARVARLREWVGKTEGR